MGLNLTSAKSTYENQGAPGITVASGTYDAVIRTVQRGETGSGTKKIIIGLTVLRAYEPENASSVGGQFRIDLWANWDKAFNAQRLGHLLMATHTPQPVLEAFDPDADANLVKYFTGVPISVRVRVDQRKGNDGKTYTDIEAEEFKDLSIDTIKRYKAQPDWKTIVGDPAKRMLEPRVPKQGGGGGYSRGGGGGRSQAQEQSADPFRDPVSPASAAVEDEDLPF